MGWNGMEHKERNWIDWDCWNGTTKIGWNGTEQNEMD